VATTAGNPDSHAILRGGRHGPNYQPEHVSKALDLVGGAGLPRRVLVDAGHGNSGKDYRHQAVVARAVADQVAARQQGLAGIVLESFPHEERRESGDPAYPVHGWSVTGSSRYADVTAEILGVLAGAVRQRRG
jgi:3-deoxy-7-phosphoheptulonate synthase